MGVEIDLVRIALSKRWGKAMSAILDEVEELATVWAASGTGCLFYRLLG
jgi:hypothetical protein